MPVSMEDQPYDDATSRDPYKFIDSDLVSDAHSSDELLVGAAYEDRRAPAGGIPVRGLSASEHQLVSRFALLVQQRDSRVTLAEQFLHALEANDAHHYAHAPAVPAASQIAEAHMEITKLPTAFYVAELVHNAVGLAIVALLALVAYKVL